MKETTPKQVWVIPVWIVALAGLIVVLLLIACYIMFWPRHRAAPVAGATPQQHVVHEPPAASTRSLPLPQQPDQAVNTPSQPLPPPPAVDVTIPASTTVVVRTSQLIDSSTNPVGSRYSATLASPLVVNGKTVVPQGSSVLIRLTDVRKTGFFHKSLQIKLALGGISVNGRIYPTQADVITLKPGETNADNSSGGNGKKALVVMPNTMLTFTLTAPVTISMPG